MEIFAEVAHLIGFVKGERKIFEQSVVIGHIPRLQRIDPRPPSEASSRHREIGCREMEEGDRQARVAALHFAENVPQNRSNAPTIAKGGIGAMLPLQGAIATL